jgi:hypothetical protein
MSWWVRCCGGLDVVVGSMLCQGRQLSRGYGREGQLKEER